MYLSKLSHAAILSCVLHLSFIVFLGACSTKRIQPTLPDLALTQTNNSPNPIYTPLELQPLSLAKPIERNESQKIELNNLALVIIDMQEDFINRLGAQDEPQNKSKIEQVIHNQLLAILWAKKNNIRIVWVEYQGQGNTVQELQTTLNDYPNKIKITKDQDSLFNPTQSQFKILYDDLLNHKIQNLIFVGANGTACVRSSMIDALKLNFSAYSLPSGIIDFNFLNFKYPYQNQSDDIKSDCLDLSKQFKLLCKYTLLKNTEDLLTDIKKLDFSEKNQCTIQSPIQPGLKNLIDFFNLNLNSKIK